MDSTAVKSSVRIHFFYVTLILSLSIILLVTFEWTGLNGFTGYLSVAATVTSLVLGILAIIFGFYSGAAISQSIGSVESSAKKIGVLSADLKSVIENGQKLQLRAESRSDQLHDLVGEMRLGIESLAKTTIDIAGSVESMPERINKGQKSAIMDEPSRNNFNPEDSAGGLLSETVIKRYVRRSSLLGLLALYAALDAQEKDQYVDLVKLFGVKDFQYVWGFLISSKAIGVIDLETPDGKKGFRVVRLKSPAEPLSVAIRARWNDFSMEDNGRRRQFVERSNPKIEPALVSGEIDEDL